MDVRQIIEYFKKPSSKTMLGMVVVILTIVFVAPYVSQFFLANGNLSNKQRLEEKEFNSQTGVKAWKPVSFDLNGYEKTLTSTPEEIKDREAKETKARALAKYKRDLEISTSVADIAKQQNRAGQTGSGKLSNNGTIIPLNIYNNEAVSKESLEDFLPYGRLIPCELVVTLRTSMGGTPIIGLVTENVYNNGKLMIPAGAEVHGTSQGMPALNHVQSGENWYVVWRTRSKNNGKELKLNGIALDNGSHWNGCNWDLLDGTAGIKGYTHDTRNISKLKDIAANVVQGVGAGLQAAAQLAAIAPGVGTATGGGASMAALAGQGIGGAISGGASKSVKVVAEQQLANVLQSQYYVTCPAGTQFYLYVKQVVDLKDAQIGASRTI
jgi:hypothetical protein